MPDDKISRRLHRKALQGRALGARNRSLGMDGGRGRYFFGPPTPARGMLRRQRDPRCVWHQMAASARSAEPEPVPLKRTCDSDRFSTDRLRINRFLTEKIDFRPGWLKVPNPNDNDRGGTFQEKTVHAGTRLSGWAWRSEVRSSGAGPQPERRLGPARQPLDSIRIAQSFRLFVHLMDCS